MNSSSQIVFIGNYDVVYNLGYEPYYNFIKNEMENGTDTFYILAKGEQVAKEEEAELGGQVGRKPAQLRQPGPSQPLQDVIQQNA